jgi:YidC/Oxa1 family membrane protein insertase
MLIPLLDTAVAAVYPAVTSVAAALSPLGGAAAAIVVCTAALRLLVLPLTLAAVRGERARAALAPQVRRLQQRHSGDPARLRAELAALHQNAGVSPVAGCLPVLAQAPLFMAWYRIFTAPRIAGHTNMLLAQPLLGAPLSTRLLGGGHPLVFVPLLLGLAVLGLLSARRTGRIAASTGTPPAPLALRLLPFSSLLSAAVLPLAAVWYLLVTLSWTAAENKMLRRGLPPNDNQPPAAPTRPLN